MCPKNKFYIKARLWKALIPQGGEDILSHTVLSRSVWFSVIWVPVPSTGVQDIFRIFLFYPTTLWFPLYELMELGVQENKPECLMKQLSIFGWISFSPLTCIFERIHCSKLNLATKAFFYFKFLFNKPYNIFYWHSTYSVLGGIFHGIDPQVRWVDFTSMLMVLWWCAKIYIQNF